MRFLLLTENWPPRVGGIENYVTHIARFLPQESVTVIAPLITETTSRNQKSDVDKEWSVPGVQTVIRRKFFWPLLRPAWLPFFIWIYHWLKRERPQVILCGKALFEGLIGYYIKKYLQIPYVVLTYAMEIEHWASWPWQRRKLIRVLTTADRVVYINDVTKQTLLRLGVQERKLVKIWPGVDQRFFEYYEKTAVESILVRYHISQPYILTVARLISRKGIDILLEAFAKLDQTHFGNVRLVVVGDGPQRPALQRMATHFLLNQSSDTHSVSNRAIFLGYISDQDLPALYAGAEFFALTPKNIGNDMEGFGIVYLEAAAAGRAVIGTQQGGAAGAIVHKATGLLVKPDSADAVHEAFVYLLSHLEEREEMGKQGRERAWHQFRWSKRILFVKGMIDAVLAEQILYDSSRNAHTVR